MFDLSKAVVLDTETTGLSKRAEIVELGIIDAERGTILMDTLLRPLQAIEPGASAIHHISAADVTGAPTWPEVVEQFVKVVQGKTILIYNANYDSRIIATTNEIHAASGDADLMQLQLMDRIPTLLKNCQCVMLYYSAMLQRQNGKKEKWRKLTVAAEEQGVRWDDLQPHRAVSDCQITMRLLHAIKTKEMV